MCAEQGPPPATPVSPEFLLPFRQRRSSRWSSPACRRAGPLFRCQTAGEGIPAIALARVESELRDRSNPTFCLSCGTRTLSRSDKPPDRGRPCHHPAWDARGGLPAWPTSAIDEAATFVELPPCSASARSSCCSTFTLATATPSMYSRTSMSGCPGREGAGVFHER